MKHANHTAAFRKCRRLWRDNLRCTIVAISWVLCGASSLPGQQRPSEYQVEAAYLYNFGRFVEWPNAAAGSGDIFTFCVLGEDPFGSALDSTLAGEMIGGKRTVAKRISNAQESGGCQVLFFSSTEKGQLKKIIETAAQQGVLTVSDMPEFLQRGGMIEFVLEGKKVRFEVNLTATERARLSLSSELLRVASKVRRNAAPGD